MYMVQNLFTFQFLSLVIMCESLRKRKELMEIKFVQLLIIEHNKKLNNTSYR